MNMIKLTERWKLKLLTFPRCKKDQHQKLNRETQHHLHARTAGFFFFAEVEASSKAKSGVTKFDLDLHIAGVFFCQNRVSHDVPCGNIKKESICVSL